IAATATLGAFTWHAYASARASGVSLRVQEERAATVQRILGARGTLYAVGDPTSLVLTHRRNPSRYIYLGGGVMQWMVDRTAGGFAGWLARIRALDPGVIVVHTFEPTKPAPVAFLHALHRGYVTRWLGAWEILVKRRLFRAAQARGVVLGTRPPPGSFED